ncbi:MAG: ATP-binding cassette domain-containing protein, partial [Bacteroidota bacterium]
MVAIDSLTKRYGPQLAINSLSFEAKQGEILGFLGPNGAGKSTTMKILTGFLTPTSGTAHVDGFEVQAEPLRVRERVGYLPEHNPLYLDMHVHEFLYFVGRIYRLSRSHLKERIPQLITQTGLTREQHKKISALSKGYRQRVGLCQALIHNPQVLILDEPTTGLDPNQIVDIRGLIREVGRDKTVIFSSHILSEVEAIADRVIIIDRGKIVADEPTAAIREHSEDEYVIDLEVANPGLDLDSLPENLGIKRVEAKGDTQWIIHTDRNQDIRPHLFE